MRCLVNRADVHLLTDPRLASADAERAAELVEGTEDRVTRLRVLMAGATADRAVGRPGQALAAVREILALTEGYTFPGAAASDGDADGYGPEAIDDEEEEFAETAALSLMNSVGPLVDPAQLDEAVETARRSVACSRALYLRRPGLHRRLLTLCLQNLFAALLNGHRTTEAVPVAREAFAQALSLHEETGAQSMLLAVAQANLAGALTAEGMHAEARPHAAGAVAALRELSAQQARPLPELAPALTALSLATNGDVPQSAALDEAAQQRLDESFALIFEAMDLLDDLLRTDRERHAGSWARGAAQYLSVALETRRPAEVVLRTAQMVETAEGLYREHPDAFRAPLAQIFTMAAVVLTEVAEAAAGAADAAKPSRPAALARFLRRLPVPGRRRTPAPPSPADLATAYEPRAVELLTLLAGDDPDSFVVDLCHSQRNLAAVARSNPREARRLRTDAVERLRPYGRTAPDVYGEPLARALEELLYGTDRATGIALRGELVDVLGTVQGGPSDEISARRHRAARRQVTELAGAGRAEEAAGVWARVLDPGTAAATLRRRLALQGVEEPVDVVAHLRDALEDRGITPFRRYWLRQAGRAVREQDPQGWDGAWTELGEPVPQWSLTGARQVAETYEWLVSPSLADAHTYLAAHPGLLERQADAAFEETTAAAAAFDDRPLDPSTFRAVR
ncbi:hypothetical protein ACIQF5_35695 [Streptomyces goshikiensis]|uniref:hypothetical protein n=1 Tax=Streptomyces goshikiensis TaxID=1942 RepID=UPI003820F64B